MIKLPEVVIDKRIRERTELTHNQIGAPHPESILAAGIAQQQAGVIYVRAAPHTLIDDQVPTN